MIINIFGSTGVIGKLTLKILKNQFPDYQINLLCAKSNIKDLIKQCKEHNPKYIYLDDSKKNNQIKLLLPKNIKILNKDQLKEYLINSNSDMTILAVSGYESLFYLEPILINSKKIGIVNKEIIVSAGHLLKKLSNKYKNFIYPLDSEHFSIFSYFKKLNIDNHNIKKIYLTASGGPFINKKFNSLKNASFKQAIKHPKWNMGYKNSIDSATLVNKCLEIIEAHYLFNLPYKKIDILIHPESLVHSIIEENNYVSKLIYFYNDMKIPLINFLSNDNFIKFSKNNKFSFKSKLNLNFNKVIDEIYPVYKYFNKLDKSQPTNLIKFNIGNQYAVDLFREKKIKYIEILQLIKEITSLNIDSDVNNIDNIILYHDKILEHIKRNFK